MKGFGDFSCIVTHFSPIGDVRMSEGDFPYKSMSTIAREFLPRAEKMHNEGMSWREVSRNLKVSYSALFIWRRLKDTYNYEQK